MSKQDAQLDRTLRLICLKAHSATESKFSKKEKLIFLSEIIALAESQLSQGTKSKHGQTKRTTAQTGTKMKKITYDKKNLYALIDCLDILGIGYTVTSIKVKASSVRGDGIGWIIEFEMHNPPDIADIDPKDVIPPIVHEMFYHRPIGAK